ncbi:MAG: aldehyde dehydrogenase family protein, partial [Ilumatobacteraceae bacterium]
MTLPLALGHSSIATINPSLNEVVREFSPMTNSAVDRAVDASHEAFTSWRAMTVEERAAVVANAAALMRQHTEELAHLITLEMGKLIGHSRAEMDLVPGSWSTGPNSWRGAARLRGQDGRHRQRPAR